MKTDMATIMRRLAEVPSVKGNVRTPGTGSFAGPGMSRYQRRSANLRERDCSIELVEYDRLNLDLAPD